ncbi:MAG: hypothetical protein NT067_07350 [Candidatus Diapherotrites archaeon]|nr:hypothetical protein [Candidatus Diapherotrites archaeon]
MRKRGIKTLAPSDAPLPNGKVEIGYKASHRQARAALKKKMLGDAVKAARGKRKPR